MLSVSIPIFYLYQFLLFSWPAIHDKLKINIKDIKDIETYYLFSFLLINIYFAFIYFILVGSGEKFKKLKVVSSSIENLVNFLYFSFVTSTTLGYGDYYPKGIYGKIIVINHIIITVVIIGTSYSSYKKGKQRTKVRIEEKKLYLKNLNQFLNR